MEKINNFRDFGGYHTQNGGRVRKGLLFRSGSIDQCSDQDLKELASLGIRTVFDLRSKRQHTRHPDRLPNHHDIRLIHLPILVKQESGATFLKQFSWMILGRHHQVDFYQGSLEMYQEYVLLHNAAFSTILKTAADPGRLPILIHCNAGKDRTGFAASLILLALGVSQELVFQEYLLTNQYIQPFQQEMLERLHRFPLHRIPDEKFKPVFEVRQEYLQTAFDSILKAYGSLEAYFEKGLSFTQHDQLQLAQNLLE